jgi:phosphatidylglycerophosphate synthase
MTTPAIESILEDPPRKISDDETDLMLFKGGKWVNALPTDTADAVTFHDIKYFYANIIDYFRVFMCVWASFAINWDQHILAGVLIICQQLLDWIDGPVARAYNQCSIFGSGIDWLADIMGQVIAMCWWVKLQPSILPWLTIATTIEVTTCIFDFATTATGKYPIVKERTGFFKILDYSMPNGAYTNFGVFLWLAYPVYVVFTCWDLCYPDASPFIRGIFAANQYFLMVPSILYIWCEAAYGSSIVLRWTELSRNKRPHSYNNEGLRPHEGISHIGVIAPKYQTLLEKLFQASMQVNKETYAKAVAAKTHFWYSIYQRAAVEKASENGFPITDTGRVQTDIFSDSTEQKALHDFAMAVIAHAYGPDEDVVLDGYGYIVNSKDCNRTQKWHLDYHQGYSTTFIPMIQVSPENCLQYLVPGSTITKEQFDKAVSDPNAVDVQALVNEGQIVSVRSCICRPFSMLRMGFGTIHRGIANRSGVDRPMFFIAVSKKGMPPPPFEAGFVAVEEDYLEKTKN